MDCWEGKISTVSARANHGGKAVEFKRGFCPLYGTGRGTGQKSSCGDEAVEFEVFLSLVWGLGEEHLPAFS